MITFVVYIMSSSEDNIVGDKNSTANTHLFMLVEKGDSYYWTMKQLFQFVSLNAEEVLITDHYFIKVLSLFLSLIDTVFRL